MSEYYVILMKQTIADWYRIHTTLIMSKGGQTFPGFSPSWKQTSSSDNWLTMCSTFLAHLTY